jgi:hypothetical protein
MRDMGDGRGGMAACVWVVQFGKSIEAAFRVGFAALAGQDLVRRGRLMGVEGGRPRDEVAIMAVRMRVRLRRRFGHVLGVLGIRARLSMSRE